jgi:hypothetical protein
LGRAAKEGGEGQAEGGLALTSDDRAEMAAMIDAKIGELIVWLSKIIGSGDAPSDGSSFELGKDILAPENLD